MMMSAVLLFFLLISLSYCNGNNGVMACPKTEKQALLSFKRSQEVFSTNLLHSWKDQVDCCTWEGVVCNNLTGHVHQLHLQNALHGKLTNPSLLNLKHLRYLDLSSNDFEGTIPAFIGSFPNLEYLNLSNAGFQETIPHTIGNLSRLRTLDLQQRDDDLYYDSSLNADDLEWLSDLSYLENLDMSYVDLSMANNWLQVINTLPSLVELHFRSCYLSHVPKVPLNEVNFSSLVVLDLGFNEFHSDVPRWIFRLNKLTYLDLTSNYFKGLLPSISNITELQYIDLSFNRFFGQIPSEIAHMCKVKRLDLSNNKLQGEISAAFGNMSDCFLGVLERLDLSNNHLSSHLTSQFGEFKSLRSLHLESNLLSGQIPLNLGMLLSLEILRLDANKFTGNLPESFGRLSNLESLYIADNMLEGVVTESHFSNLTNLLIFSASGNHLSLKVGRNWSPPFQLYFLGLGSWDLGAGTKIPTWLDTQKNDIEKLDLSNIGITDQVPSWFWGLSFLNLSHNQFYGKIPDIGDSENGLVQLLYLSFNKFKGSLPRVGNTVIGFDLSDNLISGNISHVLCDMKTDTYRLMILHLRGNLLSGEVPDCWSKFQGLRYLNLGSNNISGSIPNSIGLLTSLQSLNLRDNNLSGEIPSSIQNCTNLLKMDLSDNHLDGNIPAWNMESLSELQILILRSNKLNGKIPTSICRLNSLQIMDFSDNIFSGEIPRCVNNFTAMITKRQLINDQVGGLYYEGQGVFIESASVATKGSISEYDTILSLVTNIDLSRNNLSGEIPNQLTSLVELRSLNLSTNHLTGTIPNDIGKMKQLESLDLSTNSIFGEIPNSLAVLSSLNYLNSSFNGLIGEIPKSTQLQSQNESAFIGNELCGPPLTVKCNNYKDGETPYPQDSEENDESVQFKVDWFYIILSLGYAVGFSTVCSALILKKSWRDAYFGALEVFWNKIYVYTSMKLCKNSV